MQKKMTNMHNKLLITAAKYDVRHEAKASNQLDCRSDLPPLC